MDGTSSQSMKSIGIEFTKPFSDAVGARQLTIDFHGNDVKDLLTHLCREYPELNPHLYTDPNTVTQYILIFLNSKPLSAYQGIDTSLADGDELLFMFPISGG